MFKIQNKYKNSSLDRSIIKEYNKNRSFTNKKLLCWAPFKNMYLNIHGMVMPCWLTYTDPEYYPQKSLHDIWFGDKFNKIRDYIENFDLSKKCKICNYNIENKNFYSALSRAYDLTYSAKKYPVMMELELENTCNLECVMCNGELSSTIRKNREKREPLISPYNENFKEELKEFIPHLKEIRFNGGEPFLHNLAYKLWELIIKINPKTKIVIATNGTILNDSIKELLKKGNFHINFSIDSLDKTLYEQIRVNADFNKVMENLNYFHNYCNDQKTTLAILVNPMRQNWIEMPAFIDFCNNLNVPVWFNTIQYPLQYALWSLKSNELKNIYKKLSTFHFTPTPLIKESYHNAKVYDNFVNRQVKTWLKESLENEKLIPLTNEISNFSAEQLFFYKLKLKLEKDKNKINNTEIFELIKNKINDLLSKMSTEFDRNHFFKLINEIPIENTIQEISSNNIEDLVKMLIKFIDKK